MALSSLQNGLGSGTISRQQKSERIQDLNNATLAKAADERLNKLNFQMASLRFGMATEIAAHAPFGKSSSALKLSRDRPYNTT